MKNINKIRPFTKFCCTIGNLPSSYMISMTYEEQLLWLCNYIEKTLIPAINENAEAVIELQNLFIQLKEYVDNYFENLDVQEEINNKLDEMAESGELTEIIAQYLELAGILAYNTLSDLEEATNLNNGAFTKIYGKVTYNDGYGAFYKIRELINTDIIDGDNLVALTNYPTLVAEKMTDATIDSILEDVSNIQEDISDIQGDVSDIQEDISDINSELLNINTYIEYEKNNSRYTNPFRYYIDGTDGDDSNDGLTQETPFKTLDRFLNEVNNRSDIRCYIISSGIYYFNKSNISNCSIHITSNLQNVSDVILAPTDGDITFYNAHLNFQNLEIQNVNYFEGCNLAFGNCYISTYTRFYGCFIGFENIKLTEFRFDGCKGFINGATIDGKTKSGSSNITPLYFTRGCCFELQGDFNYEALQSKANYFWRAYSSLIGFHGTINYTKVSSSIDYDGVNNVYSLLNIYGTQYTFITTNYSFSNSYAIINHSNTIM